MNKNKIISLVILFIFCLLLTGCGEARREKKQITNNAIKYLSNKYNWKEKDIDIISNSLYGKSKKCFVTCAENKATIEYNGVQFKVSYNMRENVFSDTFQAKDIKQALINQLSEKNGQPKDVIVDLDEFNSEYYDGTNIKNVVNYLRIKAYYDNEDEFNEENANEVLKEFYDTYKGYVMFGYFKNIENYNKYFSSDRNGFQLDNSFYHFRDRYIDFFMTNTNGKIEKNTNTIITLGAGLIACGWNLPEDIIMKSIEPFDLNGIEEYDSSKYSIVSDFYNLSSSAYDITHNYFKVMMEDESKTGNYSIVQKYTDKKGDVTITLVSGTIDNRLYFTKYNNVKEMDFVILEKK